MDVDGFAEERGRWYKALVNIALPTQGTLSHPLVQSLVLWSNVLGSQNETLQDNVSYAMFATTGKISGNS